MIEAYYCIMLALNTSFQFFKKNKVLSIVIALGLEVPIMGRVFTLW